MRLSGKSTLAEPQGEPVGDIHCPRVLGGGRAEIPKPDALGLRYVCRREGEIFLSPKSSLCSNFCTWGEGPCRRSTF